MSELFPHHVQAGSDACDAAHRGPPTSIKVTPGRGAQAESMVHASSVREALAVRHALFASKAQKLTSVSRTVLEILRRGRLYMVLERFSSVLQQSKLSSRSPGPPRLSFDPARPDARCTPPIGLLLLSGAPRAAGAAPGSASLERVCDRLRLADGALPHPAPFSGAPRPNAITRQYNPRHQAGTVPYRPAPPPQPYPPPSPFLALPYYPPKIDVR